MKIDYNEFRTRIGELTKTERFDEIGNLEGIVIIERRDHKADHAAEYMCERFALGADIANYQIVGEYANPGRGRPVIESPQAGDLAIYSLEGEVKHFGRVADNQKIRSKWGASHIFEHDIGAVPIHYGDTITFFKDTIKYSR